MTYPGVPQPPQPYGPNPGQPGGYLTPPPKKSPAVTGLGWGIFGVGCLMLLGMLGSLAQGRLKLIYPDPAATAGSFIGLFLMVVLPLALGWFMANHHRRAMRRWRKNGQLAQQQFPHPPQAGGPLGSSQQPGSWR